MPPKKYQTTMTDVQSLRQDEHVLAEPDVYIGSAKPEKRKFHLMNHKKEISAEDLTIAPAIVQIFKELVTNATDCQFRTIAGGRKAGAITVYLSPKAIIVYNEGDPIPNGYNKVEYEMGSGKTHKTMMNTVETLFSKILTTTNAKKTGKARIGAGKNGIGVKAANIFAKKFRVDVGNNEDGQEGTYIWKNNMTKLSTVDIRPGFDENHAPCTDSPYTKKNYTQVEWHPDFEKFEMTNFSKNHLQMFTFMCAEFSMSSKTVIQVYVDSETNTNTADFSARSFQFSGKCVNMDYRKAEEFADLVFPKTHDMKHQLYFEGEVEEMDETDRYNSMPLAEQVKMAANFKRKSQFPKMEVIIVDTPEKKFNFTYVNGIRTPEDGGHLKAMQQTYLKAVVEKMRDTTDAETAEYFANLKVTSITNVSFIILARVENPEYDGGQTKPKIANSEKSAKQYMFPPDPKIIDSICKWSWVNAINDKIKGDLAKTIRALPIHDSKFYQSAGKAGKKNNECVLYIVEGLSASNYPKKRIMSLEGKRDKYGFLAIRGKIPNVRKMTDMSILKNSIIKDMMSKLGIEFGTDYSDDANFATLRYGGGIQILTDSDTDGMHIRCLLLNFFSVVAPGLLQRDYVSYLATPVVRAYPKKAKKHNILRFETNTDFDNWREANPELVSQYKLKYFKGLGTSTDGDIEDDVKTARIITCTFDSNAEEGLEIAFGNHKPEKGKVAPRKQWIQEPLAEQKIVEKGGMYKQKISNVLNSVLKQFSYDNIVRGLPGVNDGLKISQRQLLYAMAEKTNYGQMRTDGQPAEFKIPTVASSTIEKVHYTHGETSLYDAAFNLARNYIGANNLPMFLPIGQFGTRDQNGADGSQARYLNVRMSRLFHLIYERDIVELVEKNEEEGHPVEPKWLAGYLPMGVINSSMGMGTGWSNTLLAHRPSDVIRIQKNWCDGVEDEEDILPWYNNFTGDIRRMKREDAMAIMGQGSIIEVESVKKTKKSGEDEMDDTEDHPRPEDTVIVITGKFEKLGKGRVKVTELPVSKQMSFDSYREWLQASKDSGYVTAFKNNCDPSKDEVEFIVDLDMDRLKEEDIKVNLSSLNLIYVASTTNMNLLWPDNPIPRHYNTVNEIIRDYCKNMNSIIKKYLEQMRTKTKHAWDDMLSKIKFIKFVRKEGYDFTEEEFVERELDPKWLNIPLREVQKVNVAVLEDKATKLEEEHRYYVDMTSRRLFKLKLEAIEKEVVDMGL